MLAVRHCVLRFDEFCLSGIRRGLQKSGGENLSLGGIDLSHAAQAPVSARVYVIQRRCSLVGRAGRQGHFGQ